MKLFGNFKTLGRATGVSLAMLVMVSGVTFAVLQSGQVVLAGNTIQTASAGLLLSGNGTTYVSSLSGYSFSGLVPGGQPAPTNGYPVYVKNVGSTASSLKLSVSKPVTNPDNVDLTKVHVILSPMVGGAPQNVLLQDLLSAAASGGVPLTAGSRLTPGQVLGYNIQISLETDAMNGSLATISDIDFSFNAVAVN